MRHELKCWPAFFEGVKDGVKNFELRKDDRNFQVGDVLVLMEYEKGLDRWTGRSLTRKVKCKLKDFDGLKKGYCILGI